MAYPALKMDGHYTWDDFRTWPEGERWELIGGAAYAMAPSPASEHQDVSGELQSRMHSFFKGKKCKLFAAPMDVRLSDEDVVQPDLLVVCDPSQVTTQVNM